MQTTVTPTVIRSPSQKSGAYSWMMSARNQPNQRIWGASIPGDYGFGSSGGSLLNQVR